MSRARLPARRGRAAVAAALVAVLGMVTAACGADDPTEDVPALADRLDAVDAAIAAGDLADARTALDDLVATTTRAEDDGSLDPDQADAILAAASRLENLLPAPESPTTPPATTPSPTPPETPPEEDEDEGDEHGPPAEHGHGEAHGHDKGPGKGHDKH